MDNSSEPIKKINPLEALAAFGQSPWLDSLSRNLIDSGELARLVKEDGLKGITSNPAIFDKAVSHGADYDEVLKKMLGRADLNTESVFESVAISDIKDAADILQPVYKSSGGKDGFVSLEVSPLLARDAEKTLEAARRLFKELARSNVLIKIPGTIEGLSAIEKALAEGISINITLLFSVDRYKAVTEAYINALEYRKRKGLSLSDISSVASFFVSRIDTAADALIKDEKLKGRTAIANAKMAYRHFNELTASTRFQELAKAGAKPQRLLWASTSTKNPAYRDVLYVEELIGDETVNTIPLETWNAFRDHGKLRASLSENINAADLALRNLEKSGVDLGKVCKNLEDAGITAFADSYAHLLKNLEDKMKMLGFR
jgi:transaldolase/glucose-6-phosphate isomerase